MGVWAGWRCVDSEMEEVSAGESDASSLKPVSSIASSSSLDTCCSLTPQGYPCETLRNPSKSRTWIKDKKDRKYLKPVSSIAIPPPWTSSAAAHTSDTKKSKLIKEMDNEDNKDNKDNQDIKDIKD